MVIVIVLAGILTGLLASLIVLLSDLPLGAVPLAYVIGGMAGALTIPVVGAAKEAWRQIGQIRRRFYQDRTVSSAAPQKQKPQN